MTNKCRSLVALGFCLLVATSLSAIEPAKMQGVWFRNLDPPASTYPNSDFRIGVWGIAAQAGKEHPSFSATIYPARGMRTILRTGWIKQFQTIGDQVQIAFHQEMISRARLLEKATGWPVPTRFEIKGLLAESADTATVIEAGKQADTLMIDGQEYLSYRAEMIRLATQPANQANAEAFLRLAYLNILLFQARVPDYGTSKMIGINQTVKGMQSGYLLVQFQSRGVLGLGNSGVMFAMKDQASDVPGISVDGAIFAGALTTEGMLSFYAEGTGGHRLLGTLDFTKLQFADTVSTGGSIDVKLGSAPDRAFEVSFSKVPN